MAKIQVWHSNAPLLFLGLLPLARNDPCREQDAEYLRRDDHRPQAELKPVAARLFQRVGGGRRSIREGGSCFGFLIVVGSG
jgi:hypothetical protein